MAIPQPPPPGLLFVAVFSRYQSALDWAVDCVQRNWGPVALASPRLVHRETAYYEAEMGGPLCKQLLVVEGLIDPSHLPVWKLQSNRWEAQLAEDGGYPVRRPLNIDPGYVTLHKLVLASAKDRAHRIYLSQGIYAEPCLRYRAGQWEPWPWTYPDYRRSEYHQFLNRARQELKRFRRAVGDSADQRSTPQPEKTA
ncbi:MAG: DUF4416 family protein [Planctomycetota bacterium]|nr:MAG: DUF4416 family protein [Planctomycetota bacterium]